MPREEAAALFEVGAADFAGDTDPDDGSTATNGVS